MGITIDGKSYTGGGKTVVGGVGKDNVVILLNLV